MEHSVKSQKLLSGKNSSHTEHFQMVLRSEDRRYAGSSNVTSALKSNSVHGTPVHHIRSQESIEHHNQNLVHHHHHRHHHHHHVHDHQSSHNSSGVHNRLHSHQDQESHAIDRRNTEHSTHQSKVVAHEVMKKSKRHQHSFSDYSSGNESDDEVKTDYTYAGSGSYNSRVTPTRQYLSPNMSRSRLRRSNGSYKSFLSSDESMESDVSEDKFLKSSSEKIGFLRTSTPSLAMLGLEKSVLTSRSALREGLFNEQDVSVENSFLKTSMSELAFQGVEKGFRSSHMDVGEQVSYFTDHSSQSIFSQTTSFMSTCSSIISHFVYKFICFVTSTDTFILSRCCGSRSKKCAIFLLLLLPLLLLLLPSLLNTSQSNVFDTSYLSAMLSSKSEQEMTLSDGSGLSVDRLLLSETLKLHGQWQDELEKKLHNVLESRWQEQMRQMESKWLLEMEQWKDNILSRVSEVDVKSVNEEVMQLKSKLEQQLRQENVIKSTAQEELKVILERLNQLEEKQKVMETVLLDLENCCKKQGSLPVVVTQAELAVQLSALAQEVRTNLSQLVLLQSSVASNSNHANDGIHFTPKFNSNHTAPSLVDIEKIIKVALDRYNADKTGLVDYALESAGGSVVSTRCTESYPMGTAQFSLFGVPFWYSANTPRTVIQPQVHPGECWAMRGTQGYLVIQLSATIRPTAFSLEHIPKELSPTGKIDSAPKEFSVFGLTSEKDTEGHLLGNFAYVDNGEPLQKFNVQNADCGTFSIIELRVHSNHGNPEYTCLYRFRVHGIRQ